MIEVGQNFGKYRLIDRMAVGGMAEIFKAVAPGADGYERTVAIKRLHRSICDDPELTGMLVDEARISVMLDHPNIARVFDLGSIDGQFFIVMEFIDGVDCHDVLEEMRNRREFVPVPAALHIISETLGALHYAHRKVGPDGQPLNIVHRDVSPQNVMVGFDGGIRIVDFGIAKAKTRAQTTQAGVIKGKFYYMSPEQAVGGHIDHRADIYSAGMVLYEMITAVSPYESVGDAELLRAVRAASFPPPSYYRQDLDPELERIVMTALQRDPNRRFQSAQDFRYAIDDYSRRVYPPVNHREQIAHFISNLFGRPISDNMVPMDRQNFATGEDSMIFAQPDLAVLQQFRSDRDAAQSQGDNERTEVFDPSRVRDRLAEYDQIKQQEDVATMADIPKYRTEPPPPAVSAVPSASHAEDPSLLEVFSKPPGVFLVIGFVLFVLISGSFIAYKIATKPDAPAKPTAVAGAEKVEPKKVEGDAPPANAGKEIHLAMNSTPPNAEVLINEKVVGSTPLSSKVKVGETYTIKFVRSGYQTEVIEHTVKDSPEPLEVEMKEARLTLKVSSFPAGASVTIGDNTIGKSPLSFTDLEVGQEYEVIAKLGSKTQKKKVTFSAKDDPVKDLLFEFEKAPEITQEIIVAAQEPGEQAAPAPRKVVRRSAPKKTTKKSTSSSSSSSSSSDDGLSVWGGSKKKSEPKKTEKKEEEGTGLSVWGSNKKKKKKEKKKEEKKEEGISVW